MKARKLKNRFKRACRRPLYRRGSYLNGYRNPDTGVQSYAECWAKYGTFFPTATMVLKKMYPQGELPRANFQNFPMMALIKKDERWAGAR